MPTLVSGQAQQLEDILREGYSHPAVKGIIMFAGPAAANFMEMPLADINFNNTLILYKIG